MQKKLGLPYMGGKRKLASKIVDTILQHYPYTEYIYDVCGGGGAITFETIQRPQIKQVFYNDLNKGVVELLKKIQRDGVTEEMHQWVSRDTFMKHKNDDDWFGGFCKVVYSFGNDQKGYLFGKTVEQYKKWYHETVVYKIDRTPEMTFYVKQYVLDKYGVEADFKLIFPEGETVTERRLDIRRQWKVYQDLCNGKNGSIKQLEQLQQLEQLERLQQLQNLQQLEQLERLKFTHCSYEELQVFAAEKTVIYIDPPYKGTAKYQKDLNHDDLWNWVKKQSVPVFISEYEAPFQCVSEFAHISTLSATNKKKRVVEKLFLHKPNIIAK